MNVHKRKQRIDWQKSLAKNIRPSTFSEMRICESQSQKEKEKNIFQSQGGGLRETSTGIWIKNVIPAGSFNLIIIVTET